ncbi:MAG: glycosyltransferase family 2 protein [Microbacteriaceae bacterium]
MTLEIMMPFYGRPDHLRIAVESVLAQTDPDWRLTVVDDVYPDVTAGKWVESLGDDRITYIRNVENLRPSRNYNKCVGLTRAPFVTIMGCDDVMLPGYVERVSQLTAAHPDADIVQPGVSVIDENGQPSRPLADRVKELVRGALHGTRVFEGASAVTRLLVGNWTYFPSLVWRTEVVAKFAFREDLNVVQDLDMIMKIMLSGGKLVADEHVVFNYRRHSVSYSAITGSDGTKFAQERQLFSEIAARCNGLGWVSSARTAQMRLLSRANAFMELPRALAKRDFAAIRNLARHVFL